MPLNDSNKHTICNQHFRAPSISPFTKANIALSTQVKLTRKCRIPMSNTRVFVKGSSTEAAHLRRRIINAGGLLVDSPSDATHIVGDTKKYTDKFTLSMSAFKKLYYRSLYSECERFKADETHSPRFYRKIKEGGPTHTHWKNACVRAKPAPEIVVNAAKEDALVQKNTSSYKPKTIKKSKVDKDNEKQQLLNKLKQICTNDVDPITLEKFNDMSFENLKRIVMIGEQKTRHCLLADNAYELYKQAAQDGRNVSNPLNPSHKLTKNEVDKILKLTGKPRITKKQPMSLKTIFIPVVLDRMSLHRVSVVAVGNTNGEYELYNMGFIPADINTNTSKNTSATTSAIMNKLSNLVKQGKIIDSNATVSDQASTLRKGSDYWLNQKMSNNLSVALQQYALSLDKLG